MERVTELVALPGCCWKCRSSNREWYLDLGISIEFYGAVYVCCECILEMGRIAGMSSVEDTEAANRELLVIREKNFDLEVKVSGLEQAIDGLRIAGRSIGSDSFPDRPISPSKDYLSTPTGEIEVGSERGKSAQSLHDERVAELSNDGGSQPGTGFKFNL